MTPALQEPDGNASKKETKAVAYSYRKLLGKVLLWLLAAFIIAQLQPIFRQIQILDGVIWCLSHLSTTLSDSLVKSAAARRPNITPSYLIVWIAGTGMAWVGMLTIDPQFPSEFVRSMHKNRMVRAMLTSMIITMIAIFIWEGVATTMTSAFDNDMARVAPCLSIQEERILRCRFANMTTMSEYKDINKAIESVLQGQPKCGSATSLPTSLPTDCSRLYPDSK